MKKRAVILMNLGGPDKLESVKPFLFNLFNDKAIITLPNPFRWMIAKIISTRRTPIAQEIYKEMGGKSPILELTIEQAEKLEEKLNFEKKDQVKVFVVMRYWKPFSFEVIKEIEKFSPDEITLLPLYPQFSTTTSESSIEDFKKNLRKSSLKAVKCNSVGCFFFEKKFIQAHAKTIKEKYLKALEENVKPKILFSAHGLPVSIINSGDPYQWQVEETVRKVVKEMAIEDLDYMVTYQSRVGPVKWLEPNTEDVIIDSGKQKQSLLVVPIAFVSEHSETLVELDIEYGELAKEHGVPKYYRVAALGVNDDFIDSLAEVCSRSFENDFNDITSSDGTRKCPEKFTRCICEGEIKNV